MRPRELGVVLFTFSGLYLVYQGVLALTDVLPRVITVLESRGLFDQYPFGILFASVAVLASLAAGVVCIALRNRLSDRFFGDIGASGEAPAPAPTFVPEDWRAFWVGLIGVILVVLSLRDIAYMVSTAIIRNAEVPGGIQSLAFEVWPPRIRLAVQLFLGLFLVLGAPGLVGAWTGLRAAGRVRE